MGEYKNLLYKRVSSGNAGCKVTLLKSPDIAPFDGIGPFQGAEKGNFATSIFQIYLFVQKKDNEKSCPIPIPYLNLSIFQREVS